MTADRFFAQEGPKIPHLATGGGQGDEIADLRSDTSLGFGRVAGELDTLSGSSHSHSNKATLDAVEQALTTALKSNYDTAYTNNHTHANKATLDAVEQALTTALKSAYDGAVSNSHTHANKATLDAIEQALTTALKSAYDGAVTNSHTHSNKATLDAIEQAFTTALKSAYDAAVIEVANLKVGSGHPLILKADGGLAISLAAAPITVALVGTGFLQSSVCASLVHGTGNAELTFTSNRPGTSGNSVQIEVVAGGGGLTVGVVGNLITVTLASGGSTATAVAAAVNADATAMYMVNTVAGGTGADNVTTLTATSLAGGVGVGFSIKVNGIEQEISDPVTSTTVELVIDDVSGLAADDTASLVVYSNGLVSNVMTLGFIT